MKGEVGAHSRGSGWLEGSLPVTASFLVFCAPCGMGDIAAVGQVSNSWLGGLELRESAFAEAVTCRAACAGAAEPGSGQSVQAP